MTRFGFPALLLASAFPRLPPCPEPAGISDAMRPPADEQAAFMLKATGRAGLRLQGEGRLDFCLDVRCPVSHAGGERRYTVGKH